MLGFYIGVSSAALEEEIFKDNERSIIFDLPPFCNWDVGHQVTRYRRLGCTVDS